MTWSVSEARRRFADLLENAGREPQRIVSRNRLVGAVIDPDTFAEFEAWQEARRDSLGGVLSELRKACEQEEYRLDVPQRSDRSDSFDPER
jgi:prevent-host-death family protein